MITLRVPRLHYRGRRPVEIIQVSTADCPGPAALDAPAPSAIAPALPPPRLPHRPSWAGPSAVAAMTTRWLHELGLPSVGNNLLAAYLDRRLRRATDPAGELARIRREWAEVSGPMERLPQIVDREIHLGGAEFADDYQALRALPIPSGTGGEHR